MVRPPDLSEHRRRELADYPPSAKLVYVILLHEGALTQGTLAEEAGLPRRTVRSALDRLTDGGFVESQLYAPDARKKLFRLAIDED